MPRTSEAYRKYKREAMARRRAKDPEGARAYQRAYRQKDKGRTRARHREYFARRFFWARAMKLRGQGRANFKELARAWKDQHGRCVLTDRRLCRKTAQLDHVLPRARGGGDGIRNLRWVCEQVNIAKRHLTDGEFLTLCHEVTNNGT